MQLSAWKVVTFAAIVFPLLQSQYYALASGLFRNSCCVADTNSVCRITRDYIESVITETEERDKNHREEARALRKEAWVLFTTFMGYVLLQEDDIQACENQLRKKLLMTISLAILCVDKYVQIYLVLQPS
jgi:hypothetical protein